MKKIWLAASLMVVGTLIGPIFANAQTQGKYCDEVPDSSGGLISYFSANISVNIDNSINVEEVIDYITCGTPRHGIYRNIYMYSADNRKMDITDISVTDLDNNPYIFEAEKDDSYLKLKIGDPNTTFSTDKSYVIRYRAIDAVSHLENVDEIYWNATGNDWEVPIMHAFARVRLPGGAEPVQSACYIGDRGETNTCVITNDVTPGSLMFDANRVFYPGDGITVAVGFPKGIVPPYKKTIFDSPYFPWVIGMLLPLLTLVLSLRHWHEHGRDPKGRGAIVPQYDVPDGLSPMEVAGIVDEKVDGRQIGAEIIYLATQGFIKITELENKLIGFLKTKDYELTLLKDIDETKNGFHRNLLFYLFNTPPASSASIVKLFFKKEAPKARNSNSVKLSELTFSFYQFLEPLVTLVLNSLVSKGYYKNLGKLKSGGARWFMLIFAAIWGSLFLGNIIGMWLFDGRSGPIGLGIFLSVIVYGIVSHFSSAKTEKGVAAKEHLLGLKDYLRIAEKDRFEFHNAPDKKPEVFEKLLPFAMVLGVADVWAKEFESISMPSPSWYSGTPGTALGAMALTNSISSFNFFANSALASSPRGSGGSGGGGSSGGGGGGGGGGGW